jgi:hypothetical protein
MTDHMIAFIIMGSILVLTTGSTLFLGNLLLKYRFENKEHIEARKKGMLEDLDLATFDQLLEELRKRRNPVIMVLPVNDDYSIGFNLVVHNIDEKNSLKMLYVASAMSAHALKERGDDLPGFNMVFHDGNEGL